MLDKIKEVAAIVGMVVAGLSIPAGGIWWMSSHVAFANDQAEKQGKMELVVERLADFRIADETAKQAARETILKLCAAGRLEGPDCTEAERQDAR